MVKSQLRLERLKSPEDYMSELFAKFNYVNGVKDDFQGTYTCVSTVDKVTRKLHKTKFTPNTKVLVMYNVEIAAALLELGLKQSQITVYNNSTFKNTILIRLGFKTIFESKFNKKKTIMNAYKENFDVVLGNPPYKRRMHLDFLEKGYDLLKEDGKMVFVHPTNWMLHLRENSNFKSDSLLKEKIGNHFVSFDFYNSEDLFPGGGCSSYYPLTITTIDKSKNNSKIQFNRYDKVKESSLVNSPLDINHIGNYNAIKSIESKIFDKGLMSIKDKIDNSKKNKHYVSLNWMSGNGFTTYEFSDGVSRTFKNRYSFINNSNHIVSDSPLTSKPQGSKTKGNAKAGIPFDKKSDAEAFLYYVTSTIFVKYLIIAYNMDQHVENAYPYVPMIDSTLMYSDESIFNYFDFSKEEIELIKNTVDNYKHA